MLSLLILDRIRPALRYGLASFSKLNSVIPHAGRLLDVGCGDGLLAVYLTRVKKRTEPIVGVDIDMRKIRIAEQLDLPHAEFHHKDVAHIPSNTFDVVTVLHVLYLLPMALREEFLQHCVRVLRPGGTLVLAINVKTSGWKYFVTYLQELIMVNVLGLTMGKTVRFQTLEECKKWITKAGAGVSSIKSLDRGRPYSHAAVVAHKLSHANYSSSIGQTA